MRVLTWNLFHGRALPNAGRDLLAEFQDALAAWEWDVALLQEVPPWWPPKLGRATGASARMALTSRNLFPCLRRPIAERFPDLIKSNGGGANAILVRGQAIAEHRKLTLRHLPERRVMHAVRVHDCWVGNLHAQVHSESRAQADLRKAATALLTWAGPTLPAVLGGDTNTRRPNAPGLANAGGHDVDFVLARGLARRGKVEVLDRGALSDHKPVVVDLVTPLEGSVAR
ncbi:MAG TPA: endonuclease/exonuclease/phosphatase family protein [Solirubrobacteraceae bacterium]